MKKYVKRKIGITIGFLLVFLFHFSERILNFRFTLPNFATNVQVKKESGEWKRRNEMNEKQEERKEMERVERRISILFVPRPIDIRGQVRLRFLPVGTFGADTLFANSRWRAPTPLPPPPLPPTTHPSS